MWFVRGHSCNKLPQTILSCVTAFWGSPSATSLLQLPPYTPILCFQSSWLGRSRSCCREQEFCPKGCTEEALGDDIFLSPRTSLVAQTVKRLSTMRETQVWSLGWEDPLGKEMAIHSSTIAWKVPWTEEPGKSQESDTTERLHFHFLDICPGKGLLDHMVILFLVKCDILTWFWVMPPRACYSSMAARDDDEMENQGSRFRVTTHFLCLICYIHNVFFHILLFKNLLY